MYIKDIAVDKPENPIDWVNADNWFWSEINRINIHQPGSLIDVEVGRGWPEVVLWAEGTSAAYGKNLESFYKSYIGEKKEKRKGFTLYEIKPYGTISGKGEYIFNAADTVSPEMQIDVGAGAVSVLPIGGQVFYVDYPISIAKDKIQIPESLERRLGKLNQLLENWDSYHARAIGDKAIKRAKSLLISVCVRFGERQLREVFIAPCSDGGLQLEWKLESEQELIVKISHNGKAVTYLLIEPSRNGTFIEKEGELAKREDWNRLFDEFVNAEDLRKGIV